MRSTQRNAFVYAAIVTLGGLVFGLDLGVIAGTLEYISAQFNLTDLQLGTVGAAPGFGAIFALLVAGPICNSLGRKKSIQLIALLYLISAITSALAPTYWSLVVARFFGGLAFCSLSLASMYIGEIAPPKMRGKMVAMNQINIVVGVTAAYVINYLIQQVAQSDAEWVAAIGFERHAWRYMLGSEIIPAFVWLLLLSWIPESPRWLLSVGREQEARAAMAKLMPPEEIESEVAAVHASMAKSHCAATLGSQLRELWSRHARMATIVGIVIAAVQPITGINAILTYAPMVFEQTGLEDPLMTTIWIGVVSVLANVLAIMSVDKLGRRPVVIFGLLWCAVSLGICAWGFDQATYALSSDAIVEVQEKLGEEHAAVFERFGEEVDLVRGNDIEFMAQMRKALGPALADDHKNFLIGRAAQLNEGLILFAILSFIAAFNTSIGPVMWVVFSEIFPTQLRGIAIPAAQLVTAIVNYFVQWLFPWQLANLGARDIFLFYCVCVSAGMVALYYLLPETKNKTIEEIEAMWAVGKPT